jgi:predicted phage terminase large subunit-like protein
MENPWLFDRCMEVQRQSDGYLDLWAREHYKSTIITFGKTLQDILLSHGDDPVIDREMTFGIFSHVRPLAKDFLRQLKREMEDNKLLQKVYPDILWTNPKAEAPKWSEDEGLIVKRKTNPKEATVEAHGLVDGLPTGKHFVVRLYDDIVTEKSVTTPEMIKKINQQWGLSLSLGTEGGIERYAGTRYNFNDTYKLLIDQGMRTRTHPATKDGTASGEPVFRSSGWIAERKRAGSYIFACQQLLNPKEDSLMGFSEEDLRFYKQTPKNTNNYIVCDPANSKKKDSDYTSMWVIGLGEDSNWYVLDMIKDRLKLTERADLLFEWHKQYKPLTVGYERYGMQSDIDHFEDRMERESYRFQITEVAGSMAKDDRILRLVPYIEENRLWLPERLVKRLSDGTMKDMISSFLNEEFVPFPVGIHPDALDSLSRMVDLPRKYPKPNQSPRHVTLNFAQR